MTPPGAGPADAPTPLYQRRPLLAGLVRQWPLLGVIMAVGAGLALVAVEQWRRGLVLVGLGLGLAAVLRLLLPLPRIGFLAVRSRAVDVTLTGVAAAVLVILALTVPAV